MPPSSSSSPRLPARALATGGLLVLLALASAAGCKGGSPGAATDGGGDGRADAATDAGLPSCGTADAGALSESAAQDDFGPNAVAAKMTSALGRVNIYEVTNPRKLERVEVYLATPLASSRLTIAVHEATAMTMPFRKLVDVQIDVPSCLGWASSGALEVPLVSGRYYAIGFDPNQAVQPYVDSSADDLPVDGRLGRLIGSKNATSVSVATLTWEKVVTTEFTRQRLSTSPRAEQDAAIDASSDTAGADTSTDMANKDAGVGALDGNASDSAASRTDASAG